MLTIAENIKDEVYLVADTIVSYKNTKKLSWTNVYKEILIELGFEDKIKDNIFLINVIRRITILGYDILSDPFRLERFR